MTSVVSLSLPKQKQDELEPIKDILLKKYNMGRYRKKGLTIVELLVVISIITLLLGILLPLLNQAREQARKIRCLGNQRALTQANLVYAMDNEDNLPLTHEQMNVHRSSYLVLFGY